MSRRTQVLLVSFVAVAVVVGAAWYRRSHQLQPYREWQSQFPAAMKRPEAYGFECFIKEFGLPDFVFVRRVYCNGTAAYEEFDYASGESRKVLLQPPRGDSTALVITKDGQVAPGCRVLMAERRVVSVRCSVMLLSRRQPTPRHPDTFPCIDERVFKLAIEHHASLREVVSWIRSREWLPRHGEHFTTQDVSIETLDGQRITFPEPIYPD
ncbi:MAG: hypothetical protein R3C59_26075 [Planctomycetaceae bacterium]